jgi:hypothetical protein
MKMTLHKYSFLFLLLFIIGCTYTKPELDTAPEGNNTNSSIEKDTAEILDTFSNNEEKVSASEEPNNIENRIKEIRNWFGQVEALRSKSECEETERIRHDSFDKDTKQIPFTQTVKTCKINEDFDLIIGDFRNYEHGYEISIYKRKGKIFFVFVNGASEGWIFEDRYYADENEILIRHLEKMAFDDDIESEPNKEIEITEPQNIKESIENSLKDIDWVLEARKK